MVHLALQSLRFHWRIHLAVALGVAAATAVLTGALLVGDSVRGSLRHLALDRLGRIDEILIVDRFFRQELAGELAAKPSFNEHFASAVPALVFPSATAERASGETRKRAADVTVIGAGPEFWRLGTGNFQKQAPPGNGEVVLNAPLADELGAKVGDTITLRLSKGQQLPADSPLGRKTDRIASVAELTVKAIIPAESLGRFSLQPTQVSPRNAYVSLPTLQDGLEQPGKVNALLVAGKQNNGIPPPQAHDALAAALEPRLEDYGLHLKHVRRTFEQDGKEEVIFEYYSLTSDRMLLDETTHKTAMDAFGPLGGHPVLTYLANDISKFTDNAAASTKTGIPYSMIAAVDPRHGPARSTQLNNSEIILTSWAAEDLGVQIGDRVKVTYFKPETTHGNEEESSFLFTVKDIVPLTEPARGYTRRDPALFDQRPTLANDPDYTPEVKGITDQESIQNWDAPFPFDYKRLRDQDDIYWENHRTTPKAYISYAAGSHLWYSRFGTATSIRIPAAEGLTADILEQKLLDELRKRNVTLGMEFQPIKRQSLAVSAGTTPFDVLFLALSMFIVAAALMLVWLLFRLGVEQRASEIGTLVAQGWLRRRVTLLLISEAALVASVGALIGVAVGAGYAWLMLAGLRTWWVGAIASPFLELYVTPRSLVIGFIAGVLVSLATILLSVRGLKRTSPRQLLAGDAQPMRDPERSARRRSWLYALQLALILAAIGLAILATRLGGEAQAGAFLGSGALVLTFELILLALILGGRGRSSATSIQDWALGRLALRSASRNLGRSLTTIGLMASASFLIVSVSAFRLQPTSEGTGGFNLLAESSEAVIEDMNSPQTRREMFAADAAVLEGTTIFPLRLKGGDDASCRNLYQPQQPRVLGVPEKMMLYFSSMPETQFAWAASAAQTPSQRDNPWLLLHTPQNVGRDAVHVVLDKNTAMYSLGLYGGVGEEFEFTYDDGPTIKFRVVGLLNNSVLQGNLLISETDFKRQFPSISGYRYFLIQTPPDREQQVTALLEERLGDEGFDVVDAEARLADYLAVQNTYISTFQSLGALGLLLGTFGLAAVQLRNVFERRKELALLRATGFRPMRLGTSVLLENLFLLFAGLATGVIAAAIVVLPHALLGGAQAPIIDLLVMLGTVIVIGIATSLIAMRATLRAPLIAALRGA